MLTIPPSLILALSLALMSTTACADDFMIAAAPGGVALAQSRQDCDIAPGSSARVIYHDGQSAPISVPVDSRALVSDGDSSESSPESGTPSPAASVSLPSAEPSVPQRPRGGGLRWQSVLPGSIK
jgi:hypothetical protein